MASRSLLSYVIDGGVLTLLFYLFQPGVLLNVGGPSLLAPGIGLPPKDQPVSVAYFTHPAAFSLVVMLLVAARGALQSGDEEEDQACQDEDGLEVPCEVLELEERGKGAQKKKSK